MLSSGKIITTLSVILLVVLAFVFIKPQEVTTGSFRLTSPLPNIFTESNPQVLANYDYWKPTITEVKISSANLPEITSHAALAYDIQNDELLYERNIKKRLPLASLTKIMTAIVVIENENLNELVTISEKAAKVGENSMGLSANEKFTRRELLYGLILPSGNDAAEVLAETSSVGRENFLYLMNKKAEQLGLTDTRFTNPSGLQGDGSQYSTAYDLLVITKYGLQLPDFAEIVATVEKELPSNDYRKYYQLYNDTNLLTTYPGVKGVKTGYTYEAGMCLVTYLDYGGRKIIAILLNSENRRQEMKDLLDFSLQSVGVDPPVHQ